MDIDELADSINQNRDALLRVTTNAGQDIDIPPGARAYQNGTDMLIIHWPPADAANPFKVSRSLMLSAVNVATIESISRQAG